MSDNIESTVMKPSDPSVQGDDSVRALPDLEAWTNEIEDFVAEITHDLSEIGKTLGDRTLASSTKVEHAAGSTLFRTANAIEPIDEGNDRLGSLKRRLANLKSDSVSSVDATETSLDSEANVDG